MGNTSTTATKPSYATVTSSNPYATAVSNGLGSFYTLNPFLTKQNKIIENAVPQLYQRLANPSLDDPVSKARTQAFTKSLNSQSNQAFENNIINPLSQRNMLHSSLVNDLANNLQANQTSKIADFNTQQLANSLSDSQSLINFYMNHYKNNANYGLNTLNQNNKDSSAINSYNLNGLSGGSGGSSWTSMIGPAISAAATIIASCL
ncbi:hypothetical protein IJS77_03415 [bacterium]|nr:hypothetical protein [bacterium]